MAGKDGLGTRINKFDGTDFTFWRLRIKDYLYSKKLHQPLLEKKPEKMSDDEWEILDRQVLGIIRLTLTKNVIHNVIEVKTTEEMMSILSDIYEKLSANTKVHLMKKLLNLKMEEGASVAIHVNKFDMIISQLISVKINFDDGTRAFILLASLPNSWEPMRAMICNFVGKGKLQFSDVRDRIIAEEVHMMDSGERISLSSALNLDNRGRDRNVEKNSNRWRNRSKSSGKTNTFEKKFKCWSCGDTDSLKRITNQ